MKVQVLIIGDELLSGQIADINGPWLASFFKSKGIYLDSIKIIPDDEEAMISNFIQAHKEADIVITSGGIGPTLDDKTKNVMAKAFKKQLIKTKKAAKIVQLNYKRFEKEWSAELNSYDLVPEDFTITNNPKGLAPGLFFMQDRRAIMCAPGVPRELQAMVTEEFWPLIQSSLALPFHFQHQVAIRTRGIPEEQIFGTLCPTLWEELSKYGKVSSLPQHIGVDIFIKFEGNKTSYDDIKKNIIALVTKLPLYEYVWSFDHRALPEIIIEKAREKKLTFGFAESCTGGLASSIITDIAGCSDVYMGSITSYSNQAKNKILNVSTKTIDTYGAVSPETAKEMAIGAKNLLEADLIISFTGIAGPGGGNIEKPVGNIAIGIANNKLASGKLYQFKGDRLLLKRKFCDAGLLELLQLIENY